MKNLSQSHEINRKDEFYNPHKLITLDDSINSPKLNTINTGKNVNSSRIYNNSNIKSESSHLETAPNQYFKENKFLNSYLTSRSKNSSRIYDIPKFYFNTQLKVPDLRKFHRDVMDTNERSYIHRMLQKEIEEREKFFEEIRKERYKKDMTEKENGNDEFKGNLNDYLQKRKEDLLFMKQYPQRWPSEEAKNLVKKELKDIKIKKNIKSQSDNKKFQKRLVLQKLEKYRFISSQNPILQLNQPGTVPYLVNNGEILYKLFQEGNDECNKRYNIEES